MLSGTSSNGVPQSLEQLLERQWEQGSQFLMEQAQHFDSKIQTFSPAKKNIILKIFFPSSCYTADLSSSTQN